jgi:hypothetical protein
MQEASISVEIRITLADATKTDFKQRHCPSCTPGKTRVEKIKRYIVQKLPEDEKNRCQDLTYAHTPVPDRF